MCSLAFGLGSSHWRFNGRFNLWGDLYLGPVNRRVGWCRRLAELQLVA